DRGAPPGLAGGARQRIERVDGVTRLPGRERGRLEGSHARGAVRIVVLLRPARAWRRLLGGEQPLAPATRGAHQLRTLESARSEEQGLDDHGSEAVVQARMVLARGVQ